MRPAVRFLPVAAVAGVTLALGACGSSSSSSSAASSSPASSTSSGAAGASASASASGSVSGSVTVYAAASLKESFTALGTAFQAANPGTKITFNFGASSTLAQQIANGAPADVFASASAKNMQQVVDAKAANAPRTFAKNVLEIAVPPGNPAKVNSLQDLARSGVKVALCQPQVPCGDLARKVLAKAGVTVKPATLEADVKATLTKVQLGEVDAGLVYVTDVKAAGAKVTGVDIPPSQDLSTEYPIAALSASKNATAAQAFVDYVLSGAGQAELAKAGFESP